MVIGRGDAIKKRRERTREEDLNHRVPLIAHGQWNRAEFGASAVVVASACLSFDKRLHSRSRPTIDALSLSPSPRFSYGSSSSGRKTFTIYSAPRGVHKHTFFSSLPRALCRHDDHQWTRTSFFLYYYSVQQ